MRRAIPGLLGSLCVLLFGLAAGAGGVEPAPDPSAAIREIALDHPGSGPALVAVGPDDAVWVALARVGKLARYAGGRVDTFDLGADSRPVGLALGSAENGHPGVLWIAASFDDKLIRFEPATGATRAYPISGEASWPFNVALGRDGAVWFSQRASGRIGRLDPATGEVRHYELPTPHCGPAGLAIDPRDGAIWYSASYADRIGRLDPATGEVRELVMGEASTGLESGPAGLVVDAASGVWFAKLEGRLGHIPRGEEKIELIDVPAAARRPAGITVGPGGKVWALALDGNLVLRYDPAARRFTLYPVPTGEPDARPSVPPFARTSRPFGLAFDHQGNLWFSEQYAGQLGVLDLAPPELRVLSPRGRLTGSEALFTWRAEDRGSGLSRVEVALDGRPAALAHGRIDLAAVAPGAHQLQVTATDRAGLRAVEEIAIEYAPGPLAVIQLLERLEPLATEGTAARSELLAAARQLSRGDPAVLLPALREKLERGAALFRDPPLAALRTAIAAQLAGPREVEVRLLAAAPWLEPREVKVRPGDTVRWVYDPPVHGDAPPPLLRQIEIRGAGEPVRSQRLRAGEQFTHRFDTAGRFTVRLDAESDAGAVEVASTAAVAGEGRP